MSSEVIWIETVSVGELDDFARRIEHAPPGGVIPITRHRALAQSRNPHAVPDDPALLVAYAGDRCVGYLGLLPGLLRSEGEVGKVIWLSTWLVHPELRGQGVGTRLARTAIALDHDLIGTRFSKSAGRTLRAVGFIPFGPVLFYMIRFHRIARWMGLPRLFGYRLSSARGGIAWEEVGAVDGETAPSDLGATDTVRFVRDREILNWMLHNPWVKEAAVEGQTETAYYFSDTRPLFRQILLRLRSTDAAREVGWVILSVSSTGKRTVLRVLDHRARDPAAFGAMLAAATEYAKRFGAERIVLPHEFGPALRRYPLLRLLTARKARSYLGRPSSPESLLARSLHRIELSLCDGDIAFT